MPLVPGRTALVSEGAGNAHTRTERLPTGSKLAKIIAKRTDASARPRPRPNGRQFRQDRTPPPDERLYCLGVNATAQG